MKARTLFCLVCAIFFSYISHARWSYINAAGTIYLEEFILTALEGAVLLMAAGYLHGLEALKQKHILSEISVIGLSVLGLPAAVTLAYQDSAIRIDSGFWWKTLLLYALALLLMPLLKNEYREQPILRRWASDMLPREEYLLRHMSSVYLLIPCILVALCVYILV